MAKTFDPKKAKGKNKVTKMAIFTKGIIKENPIFVFLLGMCPALAVTSTAETAIGMGILVIFVLTMSNIVVSLIKNFIPDEVRVPSYIVVIATFVTIVEMVTEAFAPALFEALGIFIPLIVVNCLIMGRAEAFASKNNVLDSALDGLGMAIGFGLALLLIGGTREILATGALAYGVYLPLGVEGSIINIDSYLLGMEVFTGPAGGFIVIGLFLGIFQAKGNYDAFKKAEERKRFIAEKKREAAEKKRKKKAMEKAGDAS